MGKEDVSRCLTDTLAAVAFGAFPASGLIEIWTRMEL